MEKIKLYFGKYGFFIASIYFFIIYTLDDGKSTDIGYGVAFFLIGLSLYILKSKKTK